MGVGSLSVALPYVWSIKISVNRTQSKTKHTNCKSGKCVKFFRHVLKLPSIMQSVQGGTQGRGGESIEMLALHRWVGGWLLVVRLCGWLLVRLRLDVTDTWAFL